MTFVAYANATVTNGPTTKDVKVFQILKNSGIVTDVQGKIVDTRNQTLQVGDEIQLFFKNGFDTTYVAKTGDNPWVVTGALLDYLEPIHGSAVATAKKVEATTPPVVVTPNTPTTLESAAAFFASFPWWLYALLIAVAIITVIAIRNQFKNPVTSGTPFFEGGITETNIFTAMRQIAERRFGPNVRVISTERGFLNGRNVLVNYGGVANAGWFTRLLQWFGLMPKGNWRRRTFVNVSAVRATVIINNNPIPQQVYGLMGCANDVRQGDFFTGNLQFTATEVAQTVPDPATQQGGNQTATTTADELTIAVNSLPTAIGQLQKQGGGTMCITTPTVAIDVQVAGEQKITINEKVEIHVFHTTVEPSKNGKVEEPKKETAEQPVDKN